MRCVLSVGWGVFGVIEFVLVHFWMDGGGFLRVWFVLFGFMVWF